MRPCAVLVVTLSTLTQMVGGTGRGEPGSTVAIPGRLPAPEQLQVIPSEVSIQGPDTTQRLLVTGRAALDPLDRDYSRRAVYESGDPGVAVVTSDGLVLPRGDGRTTLRISCGRATAEVVVTVNGQGITPPISFPNQVVPIFTKAGCNSGGCHGKASGQNGFKLSLLGFDAAVSTTTRSSRRVVVVASSPRRPEQSLLLLKATAAGAARWRPEDRAGIGGVRRLLRWIEQGTPPGSATTPRSSASNARRARSTLDRHGRAAGARHGDLLRRIAAGRDLRGPVQEQRARHRPGRSTRAWCRPTPAPARRR